MAFKLLGGGSDMNTIVSDMNQNILELKNKEVTEIFKDDTGTRRVILDKDGLRTSPAGIDVVTASEDELTFNSSQNTLKVVDILNVNMTTTTVVDGGVGVWQGSSQQVVTAHGLSYTPVVIAYIDEGSYFSALPRQFLSVPGAGQVAIYNFRITVDSTNVIVTYDLAALHQAVLGSAWTIKIYLLQETAN